MQSSTIRAKNILWRVRNRLKGLEDKDLNDELIFSIATEKMRDIAESHLCIEASFSLSVIAGTSSYDLSTTGGDTPTETGFYRLRLLVPPSSTVLGGEEVDLSVFDQITRLSPIAHSRDIFPYKIVNTTLTFTDAPQESGTWTVHYYKSPVSVMSKTVGVETPSAFDTAIIYGTLDELVPGQYESRAEFELQRAIERWQSSKSQRYAIEYQDF